MTMTLSQAIAEASKWGNLIRSLSQIQDVLDQASVQESLRAERQKALDELTTKLAATKAEFEKVKAEAPGIVDSAKESAGKIIAEARQLAAGIVAEARKVEEQAKAEVAKALDVRNTHEALAAVAKTDLESAKAQIAAVRAQIDSALAAAREKFGAGK